jgi:phosphate-selective porin OprO and OprP
MNRRARRSDFVRSTKCGAWVVLALSGVLAKAAHAQPAPTATGASAGANATPAPPASTALSPVTAPAPASPASTDAGQSTPATPGATPWPAVAGPDRASAVPLEAPDQSRESSPDSAEKPKKGPVVQIDDKGFSIATPDRSYSLKFRGLLQTDARFFVDNDALAPSDTFLIRKFRISLDATLFSLVDVKMVPELAGTVQILDGFADLHPWPWLRLKAGKYKPPMGLERLQGDADRSFFEQSLVQNLSAQRDIGVSVWGDVADGLFHYVVGIFNGAPDTTSNDSDTNLAKDVQGRLFVRPLHGDAERTYGDLGIGVSAGTGNRKGRLPTAVTGLPIPVTAAVTGLSAFRTAGQNTFFQYSAPNDDTTGVKTTFTHERATRINPQLYYFVGPLGLMGEYMWLSQGVQKGNTTTELHHQAASATVSLVINGKQTYQGPVPDVPFDLNKLAPGAFEVGARWNWIKLDDATFGDPNVPNSVQYANPASSAKEAQAFGGVVNWIPRRSFHIGASFERTWFTGGAGSASAVADRTAENVIIARAQIVF